jgi:hypothetical protein
LLAYVAACGRTVLIDGGPSAQTVFENTAGCAGQFLMTADSLMGAADVLQASLEVPAAGSVSLATLGDLARPDHSVWNRIFVLVATYFGACVFAILFSSSLRVSLAVSATATALTWLTLHVIEPKPQLLVWSEAKSGARVALYDAWQQVAGVARSSARLTLLPQLGSVRACDTSQPIRFVLDANRGVLTAAEFDVRLFQQVSLCYSGNFPVMRAIAADRQAEGVLRVRNIGTTAWPAGALVSGYLVHDLPALAPGANVTFAEGEGKTAEGAALRTALSRAPGNGAAALWPLKLAGVANVPDTAAAWLLVSISTP